MNDDDDDDDNVRLGRAHKHWSTEAILLTAMYEQ